MTSNNQIKEEFEQIKKAQKNPDCFAPLYDKYFGFVFNFIFKRTSDKDLTGDLTSDVFLKAMLGINKYQFKGVPFSAWLLRIAVNEVNLHFRKNNKVRTISITESSLENFFESIEESYSEEKTKRLLGILQNLGDKDMQIIELRFFEGRAFKDIAQILQTGESNAKMKVYRLLEKIKEKMLKRTFSVSSNMRTFIII